MKRFIDWLKSISKRQSPANESKQAPVDDSSFSGIDQADSSIFDTGSLKIKKSVDRNAVSHKMPDLEGDSLSSAEEDIGVDPYNTGRFDTENK